MALTNFKMVHVYPRESDSIILNILRLQMTGKILFWTLMNCHVSLSLNEATLIHVTYLNIRTMVAYEIYHER